MIVVIFFMMFFLLIFLLHTIFLVIKREQPEKKKYFNNSKENKHSKSEIIDSNIDKLKLIDQLLKDIINILEKPAWREAVNLVYIQELTKKIENGMIQVNELMPESSITKKEIQQFPYKSIQMKNTSVLSPVYHFKTESDSNDIKKEKKKKK